MISLSHPISRREMLRTIGAGAAGVLAAPAFALGQSDALYHKHTGQQSGRVTASAPELDVVASRA